MRKLLTISAALIFGASVLCAQEAAPYNPSGRWYVSVQAGPMYQSNENAFSYRYNNKGGKLFTYQAAASVGYNFNEIYGLRGSFGYALNRSACNTVQTAAHGFYPYDFKSISGFLDVTLDLNGLNAVERAFSPKLYGGIGMGHTFGFSKPTGYGTPKSDIAWEKDNPFHPWQDVSVKNNAFGFRFGGIAEYDFRSGLGLFADLCFEAFTDRFNGLQPYEIDNTGPGNGKGIAGFPFDLRLSLLCGLVYRF